jgi:DNA-directed RNA polymerase specialized sigma24 family protein
VDDFQPATEQDIESVEAAIRGEDYAGEQAQDAAERLARLEADRHLIEHLARTGFAGPGQVIFEAELAEYGFTVMMAWTRTGEIIRKLAAAGRPLRTRETGPGWSFDDRTELSVETVARALVFFREEILRTGKWNPDHGGAIRTYFVGACLHHFPNVYRRWERERRRWESKHIMTMDHPDDPDGLRQISSDDDLEFKVLTKRQLEEILTQLAEKDAVLHSVAELRLRGYSDVEAARELGLSARALEGRWYRLRNEFRRRPDDSR